MADFWAAVIRGIKTPLLVLVKSKIAEAEGLDVPMPTSPEVLQTSFPEAVHGFTKAEEPTCCIDAQVLEKLFEVEGA